MNSGSKDGPRFFERTTGVRGNCWQQLGAVPKKQPEQTSAVHQGPRPIVMACRGSQAKQIAVLFERWAEELRVPVWCSAVLVREGVLGKALVSQLKSEGLPARWVESKELKLDEPIVKVMTIHAAKGLEFPMIALAEGERGFHSMDGLPTTRPRGRAGIPKSGTEPLSRSTHPSDAKTCRLLPSREALSVRGGAEFRPVGLASG